MEACSQRSSLHFYAVDVAGNTYSNGSKKATAVRCCSLLKGLRCLLFPVALSYCVMRPRLPLGLSLFVSKPVHIIPPPKRVWQLTWGVFPNCEILQPTIFDPDTFHVWKNEAFKVRIRTQPLCRYLHTLGVGWVMVTDYEKNTNKQLWTTIWAPIYDDESASNALIHAIHDSYFLVAIIDNDYCSGSSLTSLWSVFHELVGLNGGEGGSGTATHQYALP